MKQFLKSSKRLMPVVAGLMLLATSMISSAQEYTKVTRMGTSQAVCRGGIKTAAELQQFFADNPQAARDIVADAGWAGSADDILAAIANGDMTEGSYPVGTRMAWASAKVNGQYVAKRYREWAGKAPFEAFTINISKDCQVHEIAIPKICCNISLIGISPDNSEACQPKPAVEAAPADEPALALIPFIGAFVGSETRPRYEPSWDMDMVDSSGIVGVRVGLLKELSEKTAVFGQLSYYDRNGINDGNIYPEDNIALDIGLQRKLTEHTFIGGGIGAWNLDDSDYRDASLFGMVGGDIGTTNLQWFLEGRVFDSDSDNHDSLSDNKMFSAGLRYLVK